VEEVEEMQQMREPHVAITEMVAEELLVVS